MKLSDLTSGFSSLSPKQHATLRDAGFPYDKVATSTQEFYTKVRSRLLYKAGMPATELQLAYLKIIGCEIDLGEVSFVMARHAIRTYALDWEKTDTVYVDFIKAQNEAKDRDNKARSKRGRKDRPKTDDKASVVAHTLVDFEKPMSQETFALGLAKLEREFSTIKE